MDLAVVDLSRLQFALTALYHFLFVPLTLGLSFMLVIMESIYVMTRRPIWRTITRFWGVLFGINFALGVATGITMEFQFGMNWSYYSHYVGDIFGAPLAIEGLMAFFLEATFVGLMFFGWDKLGRVQHLLVTFLVALGTNLSALWILIANGWMQNPVGASFNPDTMRMEVTDFAAVLFNPVAQAKFVHTVSAGYVIAAVFVLGVSAFYLLKGRHKGFAKRSMTVAAAFGLAASLSVVVLGDESGYALTDNQKMKLAAIEAMWHTEPAPAGLSLVGLPDMERRETRYEVKVPWVLGLISTRSLDGPVEGILPLVAVAEDRIESGVIAYGALEKIKADPTDTAARGLFELHRNDLGYGLMLRRLVEDPRTATPEQIRDTAWSTVPNVPVLFWTFRIMAAIGLAMVALFATAFLLCTLRRHETRWFLWLCVAAIPLPWIAAEVGWIVAEYGRQPWAVEGVLPTFLGASSLTVPQLWTTIIGFTLFYGALAVVEVGLILHAIKKGPFAEQEEFASSPDNPAAAEPAPAVA
ncbi:MAG: cytochrome ubiquinol oxidase subunit I [Brevundimonas sp.]|uniref:cytochrome ubiquinol oxidase subunit I n=1 Tax=Brevundimonas sp. TaxID=1871086 RepID=UPI00271DB0CA|nr:cytochrome ubiquinol oxidase subunit I [Brevundimonas sp.]MDO9587300.1 cytochrome ubiquinol oxidase subunit I [Brevundimonas sp.]MDP3369009.1 cytochrome ubiquinol oxidase subunit I [Brevundimonas sp.]MDP3658174.1 cytochrome ubiquinol oxidase subunit I [Brevundimonas sp.]MDZ4110637.1 cytochrome ubiquinol oxidase subunit I [Brevundimonas sp.]